MRNRMTLLVLLAGAVLAMQALGHEETELYIPIGHSPGVSNAKSWIGEIRSLDASRNGFQMVVGDSQKYIAFEKATKIYLQFAAPAGANRLGNPSDCQAGRLAEVYEDEAGKLRWVKIRMP